MSPTETDTSTDPKPVPDGTEMIWTGMALMNPDNQVTKGWAAAILADQDEAIRTAIESGEIRGLPSSMTIRLPDRAIEGRTDTCAAYQPGKPRWYLWTRVQNPRSPAAGWREVFEVQSLPDVGLLQLNRIYVAPDRKSDAPKNPFAD